MNLVLKLIGDTMAKVDISLVGGNDISIGFEIKPDPFNCGYCNIGLFFSYNSTPTTVPKPILSKILVNNIRRNNPYYKRFVLSISHIEDGSRYGYSENFDTYQFVTDLNLPGSTPVLGNHVYPHVKKYVTTLRWIDYDVDYSFTKEEQDWYSSNVTKVVYHAEQYPCRF